MLLSLTQNCVTFLWKFIIQNWRCILSHRLMMNIEQYVDITNVTKTQIKRSNGTLGSNQVTLNHLHRYTVISIIYVIFISGSEILQFFFSLFCCQNNQVLHDKREKNFIQNVKKTANQSVCIKLTLNDFTPIRLTMLFYLRKRIN